MDARPATNVEIEQVKRDYPKYADRIGGDMSVKVYNGFDSGVEFAVETIVNASIYGTSRMWSKCGTFGTADEAVSHARTMKNRERRVVMVERTGRFIGTDGFCLENGYRSTVMGQRVYRKGKWIKSGVLA